jgi:PKD repeat protein
MKSFKLLFLILIFFSLNSKAQNCNFTQVYDANNNRLVFYPSDSTSTFTYIFIVDGSTLLNNLTGNHSAAYTFALNDTLEHTICFKIVDLISQQIICENCTTFIYGQWLTNEPPNCEYSFNFNNDSLSISLNSVQINDSVSWIINGAIFNGSTLALPLNNVQNFNVSVSITNLQTNLSCTNSSTIENPFYVPIAICNINFESVSNAFQAYFIDVSTGVNINSAVYHWDFGDGNYSSQRFVSHTYQSTGNYNVCLSISDSTNTYCNDTICQNLEIIDTVINNGNCSSYFVFTQIDNYNIGIINLSTGLNPSFSWNFGDGAQSIINSPNPSYEYSQTGYYNICLTVETSNCMNVFCDSLFVDSQGNLGRGLASGFFVNVYSPEEIIASTNSRAIPKNFNLLVYPNPFSDVIFIETKESGILQITDILGKTVKTVYCENKTSIDLKELDNGIYFIKTENGKTLKIVKN